METSRTKVKVIQKKIIKKGNNLCSVRGVYVNGVFLFLAPFRGHFKIIAQSLNINYKLFGLLDQAYY